MPHFRAILVCLLLAIVSWGQEASTSLYKLSGNVIDGASGTALPRVLVRVSGRAVLTAIDGSFSFNDLPPGKVQVMVSKPGYFLPGDTGLQRRHDLAGTIDIGPNTSNLALKLLPEAVIFGQVAGDDGEPIERAEVQALTYAPIAGYLRPRTIALAQTDEDGNYRIAGLPKAEYYVTVKPGDRARRLLKATGKDNQGYPLFLFYPGAPEIDGAAPVYLLPGQHQEINFALNTKPAYAVSGKIVVVGEWRQINEPLIVKGPGRSQPILAPDSFDRPSGKFEFRALPAGTYALQVTGIDEQGQSIQGGQRLVVTHPIAHLKLALRPGVNIPVVIRTDFTKSAAHHNCAGSLNGKAYYFNCFDSAVAAMQFTAEGEGWNRNFIISPDSPLIHGLPIGLYRVTVNLTSPEYYVESMRSGAQDLLREQLLVGESVPPPIEITVRDNAATLKVQVEGSNESQEAGVLVVPEGEPPVVQWWSGGGDRTIEVRSLAPGAYQVFAFDSIDRLSYAEPGALDDYADRAAKVNLAAGGTATVSVEVAHVEE